MEYSKKQIHSFIKCHGGKSRYAKQYINTINADGMRTYCEPYAGGAGVFFNIPSGIFDHEIINDYDNNLSRCLITLRDDGKSVKNVLNCIDYNQEYFDQSKKQIGHVNGIIHTSNYIIRNRFSSGGLFDRFAKSDRLRGGRMGDENAWINFRSRHIDGTIERLRGVEIYNDKAIDVMKWLASHQIRSESTLYFLDPPYLNSTLVKKNPYFFNMTEDDHIELLEYITNSPGRYYLCGYFSELYNDILISKYKWRFITFNRHVDSGRTKTKSNRIEYLYSNI